MGGYKRVFGIAFIWMVAAVGWLVLGGVTVSRRESQESKLRGGVQSLWGSAQQQDAPKLSFSWATQERQQRTEQKDGVTTQVSENVTVWHEDALLPDST